MRVLVIEDDRKVASFIETGLTEESYAVDVLYDGVAAGDQANAIDYDAVVLDLMLPGRTGFQALRRRLAVLSALMFPALFPLVGHVSYRLRLTATVQRRARS